MRLYLLLSCFFIATSLKALSVAPKADSVILVNAKTGAILYEKNPDKRTFPASLTKILTAYYTLEKNSSLLPQLTRVSEESLKSLHSSQKKQNGYAQPAYWLEDNVVLLWVHAGLKLPLKDLLYGMMLKSANDAANALAEAQSGSIPKFMEEVNTFLSDIGCIHTHFMNPHGIHHPNHYSTARDLSRMTVEALKNPAFIDLISTTSYAPSVKFGPTKKWEQVNRLITKGKYYYPFAIGGKTGYHSSVGYNLIGAAEKDGRLLLGVLIGCADKNTRYEELIKLFDAAFAESKEEQTCFTTMQLFTCKVETGDVLKARLKNSVALSYFPSEKPRNLKAYVAWDSIELPIQKGQKVGQVQLFSEEKLIQFGDLYACETIQDSFFSRLASRLRKLF